jgi:[ribosomal protein S18]-alanine N-acetyltransferase
VKRHDAAPPGRPATPPAATPGITLRPMTPADLPAVLRLEAALFGDEAWSEAMLTSELEGAEASGRYYLIAEDAGGLVGYAGLLSPGGSQADVLTMAVAEDRWGQRIGAMLLDSLVAEAARQGCTEVFLEVRVDNDRAQRLYRSRGFAGIGVRRDYYQPSGTDALVMQLSLPRPRRFGFSGARSPGPRSSSPRSSSPRSSGPRSSSPRTPGPGTSGPRRGDTRPAAGGSR